MAGPSPFTKSSSSPMPSSGGRISAKIIAASRSKTFIGCKVTSQASSGVLINSKIEYFSANLGYSSLLPPALPHSQDGGASTVSRRQAAKKRLLFLIELGV